MEKKSSCLWAVKVLEVFIQWTEMKKSHDAKDGAESKTPSCLVNGPGCCVRASILVPVSIWVSEIVNSGFGAQKASSSHLP